MESRSRHRARHERGALPTWKRVLFGGVSVLIILGTFYGVYTLTRLPEVTVKDIVIAGSGTIPHEELMSTMTNVLQGSYFGLIPHRFTLLYPKDEMLALLSTLPRLHTFDIEREGTTLTLSYTEYEPDALWCGGDGTCVFIDKTGYAFSVAPELVGGTLVRHEEPARTDIAPRMQFDAELLSRMNALLTRLTDELSLRVTTVQYDEHGDIRLLVNGGGVIMLTKDEDFSVTFERLRTLLGAKEYAHLEPGNFQYIDLRFGKKIFVNEELVPTSTTTPSTTDAL